MNDRVRIYDLARQMNLENQVVIDALREMGYDIKSHSSSIDSHFVSLLVAALTKKKQSGTTTPKTRRTSSKSAEEKPEKTARAAAPVKIEPPPLPVKPRVLSRRKPTPVVPPAGEFAAATPETTTVQALGSLLSGEK